MVSISEKSVSLESLGAALRVHEHATSEITSGVLPVTRGGTGATVLGDGLSNAEGTLSRSDYRRFVLSGVGLEPGRHRLRLGSVSNPGFSLYASTVFSSLVLGYNSGHFNPVFSGSSIAHYFRGVESYFSVVGYSFITVGTAPTNYLDLIVDLPTLPIRYGLEIIYDGTGILFGDGPVWDPDPVGSYLDRKLVLFSGNGTYIDGVKPVPSGSVIPITSGGTGATTAAAALTTLGAAPTAHTHTLGTFVPSGILVATGTIAAGTQSTYLQVTAANLGALLTAKTGYVEVRVQCPPSAVSYVSVACGDQDYKCIQTQAVVSGFTSSDYTLSFFVSVDALRFAASGGSDLGTAYYMLQVRTDVNTTEALAVKVYGSMI